MPDHLLVTVLGIDSRPAQYSLEDRCFKAPLAPVALFSLLPEHEKPTRILALCTPQARRKSLPLLREALEETCPIDAVDVPEGHEQEDVAEYVSRVAAAVSEFDGHDASPNLTVDVTHGFRHFSFLTYLAVLYLVGLRGVTIRAAYYGMLQRGSPSPFLDLRPLLELPRWIHALETLRNTGSTLPLAEAIRHRPDSGKQSELMRCLSAYSHAYLSGLPMELGRHATTLLGRHEKALRQILRSAKLPLSDRLVAYLREDILDPFAVSADVTGNAWKRNIRLTGEELRRQATIIDDLLKRGNHSTAIGLMNEWTLSWAVQRTDHKGKWLDYRNVRSKARNQLNAIRFVAQSAQTDVLTDSQRKLGKFWHDLCALRNGFNHHGMRYQDLSLGDPEIEAIIKRVWKTWGVLRQCPDIPLSFAGSGSRVLVSPIGRRPGVLFSALHACRDNDQIGEPTCLLVICSHETQALVDEAVLQADYSGEVERVYLENPWGGIEEIVARTNEFKVRLVGAECVVVNVTGGTTLMGLVADRLANEARRLACPTYRFGLIDRRSTEEQRDDPYRIGDSFWLDDARNSDNEDD